MPHISNPDPYGLQRFLDAQSSVYKTVLEELSHGKKRRHWMWFVFPQVDGLGHSALAKHFSIQSCEEARAYLLHPILGERLKECTQLVIASAQKVFPSPDDMKFRSSMTLFGAVGGDDIFQRAIDVLYAGNGDYVTLSIIKGWQEETAVEPRPVATPPGTLRVPKY